MASLVHIPRSLAESFQRPPLRAGDGRALHGVLRVPLHAVVRWWQRHEQRERLLELDERMLRDIGLTRVDALHEARKAFWQD